MSVAKLSIGSIKPRLVRQSHTLAVTFVATIRHLSRRLHPVAALLLSFSALQGAMVSAQTAHFTVSESILTLPSLLSNPAQVAVDTKGNIYIADQDNYRVVKETPSVGGFIETSISMGTGIPYGLAVDQAGNIYIACNNEPYVIKETLTPSGYTQSTFGSDLFAASALAVDSNGVVYVATYTALMEETPSAGGYVQSQIPLTGTRQPFGVAVDSSFNLYITGLDFNYLGHVWKLTPSIVGYTQTSLSTNPSGFGELAVDGAGNIYVANGSYSNIIELAPSGGGYIGSSLPQESFYFGYLYMFSVAVDQSGDVFFIDYFNDLLGEYSPAGGNAGPLAANGGYSSQYTISEFFSIDTPGTTGTEGVVPVGSNSSQLDFYDAGTGSCEGGYWSQGDVCSVDVYFQPIAVGDRSGTAVLYDGSGNTIATGYARGIGKGPLVNFSPGAPISENIASAGSAVALDVNGNLYTVAPGRSTAFEDTPSGGASWTEVPIGSGLGSATGIAIDGAGNLYIADQANREIVKETLTQNGYSQSVIANQSNGLNQPAGVTVDISGNVYLTDPGTNAVLKETLLGGTYTQSVLPTSALSQPNGVAVDSIGSVYIVDTNNNRVLKETLAGSSYMESTIGTGLSSPTAVAVDGFGNVYISETNAGTVLKETLTDGGYVQSILASGIQPYGLATDSSLNLYIAGSSSQSLLKVDVSDAPSLSFASTPVGSVSTDSPRTVKVANNGNAALIFPIPSSGNDPSISTNFTLNSSGGTACPLTESTSSSPGNLPAGASCTLSMSFSPEAGGSISGALILTDNNLNAAAPAYASQTITLQGMGMSPTRAVLTTPTPGLGTVLGTSSVNFQWSAGTGVTLYQLNLGINGPGSSSLYATGGIASTSVTVPTLPANGVTVYARLFSKISGAWQYNDYVYTEPGSPTPAVLTTPTPGLGTVLGTSGVNFQWSAGTGVTLYQLNLGINGPGSSSLYATGGIASTSVTVPTLPADGVTVYARLFSKISGVWQYNDYVYTEPGSPTPAVLTTPTPGLGTVLGTSSVNFQWSAGTGVTLYQLNLGINAPGSSSLYATGGIASTSVTVPTLPANGVTVYARLFSKISGAWQYNDYVYTEPGSPTPAVLTTPTPGLGTVLGTSSVNFQWSAGTGVTLYQLNLGINGPGSASLYATGGIASTSVTVPTLPANGVKVYARLFSKIDGVWQYSDYVYTESGP